MILDKGIARFFHPAAQKPGGMESRDGILFHAGWYGELTVGLTRYYTARQSNDRVDKLIRILRAGAWDMIGAEDYCVLADGYRYRILQVQTRRDEEAGEDVADISVERTGAKDVGEDHT